MIPAQEKATVFSEFDAALGDDRGYLGQLVMTLILAQSFDQDLGSVIGAQGYRFCAR